MNIKLLLAALLCLGTLATKAQTSVSVYAGDSTWGVPCTTPAMVDFFINGYTQGYTASDSAHIYVNFGDGSDTNFMARTFGQGSNFTAYAYVTHTYTTAGWYSTQYIVTMPDGNADTLSVPNEILIGDTCGAIDGKLYNDMNSNCTFDAGDIPLAYQIVTLHAAGDPNPLFYTWTDSLGNYYFNPPLGISYDIIPNQTLTNNLNSTCPSTGVITTTAPASGQDFAFECTSDYDLVTGGYGFGFVPGTTTGRAYFGGINQRCLPVSGKLKLVSANSLVTPVSFRTAPDAISGDTLIWNFSNLSGPLSLYNYWSNFGIGQWVRFATDTTAQIGDTICFELFITPTSGDANPADNYFAFCAPVRTSYDPNDKQVSPLGSGADGFIEANQTMTYTVRFQNTGTASAMNIYILDTIDTSVLDLTTIDVLATSHDLTGFTVKNNNVVKFRFDGINLPDSNANEPLSHGFVTFQIDQKPNLAPGTVINNTAGIYFDWNPAVITNTTTNRIELNSSIEESFTLGPLTVFPNPTKGLTTVLMPEGLKTANLEVYTTDGRLVYTKQLSQIETTLDLSKLRSGLYQLRLNNGGNVFNQALIIE